MKKRNKRYNPRKNLLNIRTPHLFAAKAANSKPLPDWEIERVCSGVTDFINRIKAGTCKREHVYFLVESVYLFICLIDVIQEQKTFGSDDFDTLARLEFAENRHFALNSVPAIIDSIDARHEKTGRFIANGDEIRTLETLLEKMRAIFGIVNQSHYVQAFLRSEPYIAAATHRNGGHTPRNIIGART